MEEAQDGDITVVAGVRCDAWFGSVKAATALDQKGYKAVLQVKTGHGLSPKKFIEDTFKVAPGSAIVHIPGYSPDCHWILLQYSYNITFCCN